MMRLSALIFSRLAAAILIFVSSIGPFALSAPTTKIYRIGVLNPQDAPPSVEDSLRNGLRKLGYEEGRNISIEWRRSATTRPQMSKQASDLAGSKVDLIVALGTPATRAAFDATTRPIVFAVGDPVASGFATSLAEPGGRATGVSTLTTELNKKRLQLLCEVAPGARLIAYLNNTSNPLQARNLLDMSNAAQTLGTHLLAIDAQKASDLDEALQKVKRSRGDAFLISSDLSFLSSRDKIAKAIREAGIPGMFPLSEYHDAGVLMSYGPNMDDAMFSVATYVDRILRGAHPAELPIEQVATYNLVIDLRIAREMRIRMPQDLLLRANRVIQ